MSSLLDDKFDKIDSFGTDSESFKTFSDHMFLKKITLFWKNGILSSSNNHF